MKAYKILNNREPCHDGSGKYPYRKWLPVVDDIKWQIDRLAEYLA